MERNGLSLQEAVAKSAEAMAIAKVLAHTALAYPDGSCDPEDHWSDPSVLRTTETIVDALEVVRAAYSSNPHGKMVPELTLDGPIIESEPLYANVTPGRFRQWLGRLAGRREAEVVRADSWPPATHGRDYDPLTN